MTAFQFNTVPSLVVEFGAARRLGELLRDRYAASRICLVTDKFLHASGMLAPAFASLREHGWEVSVIDDVVADPPDHVIRAAAVRAREARAEIVLGLGGGSSMDVAKLIAVLCRSDQPLEQMYGVGKVAGPRSPLVLMPTTAGTGSEVTSISIVTTGATTKSGVVSPVLLADLAILDAEMTLALPPAATAATGIDAMVHAIEAYTSARLKNPLSDQLARQALMLLAPNLLTVCRQPENREARQAMLLGAALAGQAFCNAPVAAVHALAYPLGGHFHVAHGLSNALVLTHVLRFNAPSAAGLYAELADLLIGDLPAGASPEHKTGRLIDFLDNTIRATGIPRTLREVGVAGADIERLASDAMLQQRLLVNNPREMTLDDVRRIYELAL